MRQKLRAVQLDNGPVYEREKRRQAQPDHAKAPWPIKFAYFRCARIFNPLQLPAGRVCHAKALKIPEIRSVQYDVLSRSTSLLTWAYEELAEGPGLQARSLEYVLCSPYVLWCACSLCCMLLSLHINVLCSRP